MSTEEECKREAYNKMLSKIAIIANQIEEEKKKSERFKILLEGRLDTFRTTHDRAF